MEQKINIAELLKDCPTGMELYSPMLGVVYFDKIVDTGHAILIKVTTSCNSEYEFYPDGKYNTYYTNSEIMLFPSKEQRDWSKFQQPFKDGDVVINASNKESNAFIYAGEDNEYYKSYVGLSTGSNPILEPDKSCAWVNKISGIRLATEEEKQKLFDAIKENGYKWNEETKTLEKLIEPKFKVGNKIKHKNGKDKNGVEQGLILFITDDTYDVAVTNYMGVFVPIADQDEWELVPNKFDISTLKPFDKVLCRDSFEDIWTTGFYSHFETKELSSYYVVNGTGSDQCIPYNEETKHLLGTTDDCDGFYKTWE